MADSLRDQLIKAGLASTSQARKAEREKRVEEQARRRADRTARQGGQAAAPPRPRPDGTDPESVRARALRQQEEKAARDRTLAKAINDKAAANALRAEIRQIILQHDQRSAAVNDADVAYNFVHGKAIKKIYVPPAQRDQIVAGTLVIVNNDGRYHLIAKAVAEQIAARDPKRIMAVNRGEATASPDDEFYARFQVPDDLDW